MSIDIDQQHVLDVLAKELAVEAPAPLRRVEVMVIGSGMDETMLRHLRLLGIGRGLDIITHIPRDPQEVEREQRVLLVDAVASASRRRDELADIIRSIQLEDDWPMPTMHIEEVEPPTFQRHIKQQSLPKLNQFLNNQRSKGPPIRKQFSMQRPPRRGGRS